MKDLIIYDEAAVLPACCCYLIELLRADDRLPALFVTQVYTHAYNFLTVTTTTCHIFKPIDLVIKIGAKSLIFFVAQLYLTLAPRAAS